MVYIDSTTQLNYSPAPLFPLGLCMRSTCLLKWSWSSSTCNMPLFVLDVWSSPRRPAIVAINSSRSASQESCCLVSESRWACSSASRWSWLLFLSLSTKGLSWWPESDYKGQQTAKRVLRLEFLLLCKTMTEKVYYRWSIQHQHTLLVEDIQWPFDSSNSSHQLVDDLISFLASAKQFKKKKHETLIAKEVVRRKGNTITYATTRALCCRQF